MAVDISGKRGLRKSTGFPNRPSNHLIRDELARILRHRLFSAAPLQREVLQLIVSETLRDGGEGLKEEVIAELLGRTDYDKSKRSVIRGDVRKIRQNLYRYYLVVDDARVRIEIPKHSFVATFEYVDASASTDSEISNTPVSSPQPVDGAISRRRRSSPVEKILLIFGLLTTLGFFLPKTVRGEFGSAVVLLGLGVILTLLILASFPDSLFVRTLGAVFLLAAMAYFPSAWTLSEAMHSVINMETLPPAVLYPFITGLKFIPLFVLVCGFWVGLGFWGDVGFEGQPALAKLYLWLGILFVFALFTANMVTDDYNLLHAAVPARAHVLFGYLITFAANFAVWRLGFGFFRQKVIRNPGRLFIYCFVAYFVAAIGGSVVDHEYNTLNRCCLDMRHPVAYASSSQELLSATASLNSLPVGTNLREMLLYDPEVRQAFATGPIFKQPFDEAFQEEAVTLGFKDPRSTRASPIFIIIRLPRQLAESLRLRELPPEY
jgi:hypothetical protein